MNKFDRSDLILERWNYLAGTTGNNRSLLTEDERNADSSTASAGQSKLTDEQKKSLNQLAQDAPTNLVDFVSNLKKLAAIVNAIDPSGANLGGTQLTQYWAQIMAIIGSMMSEEKTSSADTSKVKKALG
jgi:hypothetical protein